MATAKSTAPEGSKEWLHEFQYTLPLRGATQIPWHPARRPSDFNPRSPCGERRQIYTKLYLQICIV